MHPGADAPGADAPGADAPGIQPTGIPHIGNYLGFIQKWVQSQQDDTSSKMLLSIADLHSITVGFPPPEQLRLNIIEMLAALLASGVDPEKTIIFQQSQVPEHTELAWILSGLQTIPALQRITQYKDKSSNYSDGAVPVGLLCYPLLQAADVLLYKATHVLVGEDQTQHMTILKNVAEKFNVHFKGEYFPVPKMVSSAHARVRSLQDPHKKMSKSDPNQTATIFISDSADVIRRKCQRAISDSERMMYYDPDNRPAVSNLITLHSYFSGVEIQTMNERCKEMDTLQLKRSLADAIEAEIGPIRDKYKKLIEDKKQLRTLLKRGSQQAKEIAAKNLEQIKTVVGFN
ncbi:tRNA synthetases class I (W and y) domain-containing protein [Ditylenchus destructor]|uniref:tryptophan--tRNA ligase n=1 Tax=Ditylenchus destructor TaxID=166010 RepID=A0AAD4R825_9BILA|nr:tRNA synthetases class I (W and y) domain-containing protein [Ditylenchus destructor]